MTHLDSFKRAHYIRRMGIILRVCGVLTGFQVVICITYSINRINSMTQVTQGLQEILTVTYVHFMVWFIIVNLCLSFTAIIMTIKSFCYMDLSSNDRGRQVRKQQMIYFAVTNFFELPGYIILTTNLLLIWIYGGESQQIKNFNQS